MRVLLIGGGGREHALAWAIAASPVLSELYCAPGNAGIAQVAEIVALDVTDHPAVLAFCKAKAIDLVIVGPEAPLVAGLTDDLTACGITVFGPTKAAAQLEGSKAFTKAICDRAQIPTAAYGRFDSPDDAKAYVRAQGVPIVIKDDGLAAGKGVVVATALDDALAACDDLHTPGSTLLIEEFLEGEEASFFAITDGQTVVPLATAQDHKRAFDGDAGPNTGGMGAYSPAPVLTPDLCQQVMDDIVQPTVDTLKAMGSPYVGILYAGLMITADGPKLLEYNARFGDPEAQVLMPRLKDDLLLIMKAAVDGVLGQVSIRWNDQVALTVVMATKGYPGSYPKGSVISGVEDADAMDGVTVFHAGTQHDGETLIANGGRVLAVTALGPSVQDAQTRAYAAVARIDWPDGFCRSDIGWRAIERERKGD